MALIILVCILFGLGGLIFSIIGGLIKFSVKLLVGGIIFILILICAIQLIVAGMFFGGLVLLF